MRWTWDPNKTEANKRKHGIAFETAELVFYDDLAMPGRDPYRHEDRYRITGMVHGVILRVVYTLNESDFGEDDEFGRIISARKAIPSERRRYEESQL